MYDRKNNEKKTKKNLKFKKIIRKFGGSKIRNQSEENS